MDTEWEGFEHKDSVVFPRCSFSWRRRSLSNYNNSLSIELHQSLVHIGLQFQQLDPVSVVHIVQWEIPPSCDVADYPIVIHWKFRYLQNALRTLEQSLCNVIWMLSDESIRTSFHAFSHSIPFRECTMNQTIIVWHLNLLCQVIFSISFIHLPTPLKHSSVVGSLDRW